jgi:secondary thiamine-phosphate synthase enzyme
MDTLETTAFARHVRFAIPTGRPLEFIDLTDRISTIVAVAGLRTGLVNIQTLHTTTAIVVNEHEPLLLDDFAAALERAAPSGLAYAHDDPDRRTENLAEAERTNGHAHCRALFLPSSACLNVVRGTLQLGRWQRVFLVELDGPQERNVSLSMIGEGCR